MFVLLARIESHSKGYVFRGQGHQCKLYSSPVGNKAVQEAAAGRAHEKADFGIVVSNNRYTAPAEELANTNRVLLLHYRDLPKLEAMLAQADSH